MKRFFQAMNTTAARLSALYLLLFSVCAVLLVFYMTSVAARFVVTQTRTAIVEEINSLDRAYRRGGLRRLVVEIDRRSRAPGANLYMIADETGRILSGNVTALQPGVLDEDGWKNRPFTYARFGDERSVVEDPERAPRAIAQVLSIQNGLRILVGRDIGEPEQFRGIVRRALSLALLIMGLGGLVIWLFVGRRALRRIDGMSAATARIMDGDLSGRLPVTPANDEFDRLSQSLNTMLGRISLLNDGLRQVSDSIAHDLKTPLTRLRNKAEKAQAAGADTAAMREALDDITAEADHLIKIFNALLLISRVEAGYTKEPLEPVDLDEIASGLVELFEPVAEDDGAVLTFEGRGPTMVRGNRELIGQTLTNLIENALKYGRPAGDEPARIRVRIDQPDQARIILSVADNGPGVPEADRERVLGRFVRIDESRSESGSGLGLSLVAAIMALHGGKIALHDAEPGLRVDLSFPTMA